MIRRRRSLGSSSVRWVDSYRVTKPLLLSSCTDSLKYLDDKCHLKLFRMDVSTHTLLCEQSHQEAEPGGQGEVGMRVGQGGLVSHSIGCSLGCQKWVCSRVQKIRHNWGFPSHLGSLWPQCYCCLHVPKSPGPPQKIINIFSFRRKSFRRDYWHMWLTQIPVLHAWNVLSSPLRSLLPHWPLYSAKEHFNLPHCWAAKWFLLWLVLLNVLSMLTGSIKPLGVSLKLF